MIINYTLHTLTCFADGENHGHQLALMLVVNSLDLTCCNHTQAQMDIIQL